MRLRARKVSVIENPEMIANHATATEIVAVASVSNVLTPDGIMSASPGPKGQIATEIRISAEILQPLSLKLFTRLFLLAPGGPRSRAELEKFRDDVVNRFDGQWEHAVEYANKSNDRFLNKARGLLTFDGLVLTTLGAVYRESHRIPANLVLVGSACAVFAAGILLLNHFLINFGDLGDYDDAKKEFPSLLTGAVIKAKSIVVSGLLSLVALLCLITSLCIVVLSIDLR